MNVSNVSASAASWHNLESHDMDVERNGKYPRVDNGALCMWNVVSRSALGAFFRNAMALPIEDYTDQFELRRVLGNEPTNNTTLICE